MIQGALVIFIYAGKLTTSVSLTWKKGIWTLIISRKPGFLFSFFCHEIRGWVKDGQQCHTVGKEWEDACGQQQRTVGAPANRAKHDLMSWLQAFFLEVVKKLWELCPPLSKPACAKLWQVVLERVTESLCLYRASMFPPKTCINRPSLPVASLGPSAAFGQTSSCANMYRKLSLDADLPSLIPLQFITAAVGWKSMSKLTSDLHLWGEHSELLYTELKLLTLDVYCIFLKK